jgi:hypothetical protein
MTNTPRRSNREIDFFSLLPFVYDMDAQSGWIGILDEARAHRYPQTFEWSSTVLIYIMSSQCAFVVSACFLDTDSCLIIHQR